jgi:hypothetical protein
MENALSQFLSLQTIVYCIVIYFITMGFRFVIEALAVKVAYVFPDKWEPQFIEAWREWILPSAPVILGGVVAYALPMYPYPEVFATSITARVFFGMVAGGASGNAYRFFKYYVNKFTPSSEE